MTEIDIDSADFILEDALEYKYDIENVYLTNQEFKRYLVIQKEKGVEFANAFVAAASFMVEASEKILKMYHDVNVNEIEKSRTPKKPAIEKQFIHSLDFRSLEDLQRMAAALHEVDLMFEIEIINAKRKNANGMTVYVGVAPNLYRMNAFKVVPNG